MSESIADRFVTALAAVREINPDNSHPMRHALRGMKREAEAILSDAIERAYGIAMMAETVKVEFDKAKGGAA